MENATEYKLESVVSGDKAETLASDILGLRGSPLSIDASEVSRIDTPCISVLIAAQKLWSDEDCALSYGASSDAFNMAVESLGIEKSMIETGEV